MAFKILTDTSNDKKFVPTTAETQPSIKSLPYNPNGKKTFCYWTVADGKHGEMAKATVKSARNCGVKADFHIWTDLPEIEDATVHPCGNFDKKLYMFKFHFLKNEVKKLNYDYYVFFDADNFFVRDPGDLTQLMSDTNRVFVQMENVCNSNAVKRGDWWSCPIGKWANLLNDMGVRRGTVWNTNAGFWIVERGVVDEFYSLGVKFFEEGHRRGYKGFTEEPPLAYIGHMLQKPEDRVFDKTNWLWASDWTGQWKDKIPTGGDWQFEDYMSGEKKKVNPAIVHAMRSKDAMIKWYKGDETETFDGGYWSGHNLLGDVIGFVAAAHLMYVKTGKRQKVWFQESRKGILDYFDGVDWVPRESIPNAIDAGRDPKREEWDNMNGVKRFYKWMDPSLTNPKTFDIHMKGGRKSGDNLIGLITHANTQGDIPDHVVDEMIAEARKKYPEHKIVAIGNMDNKYVPKGVEDWRQSKGDIKWIVETVRKLDLLITPQTGPCFIAAGYRIPMWVYRSKEAFWDNVLNYDTYKVERWWERFSKPSGELYLKGNYRKSYVSKFEKFEKLFENKPLKDSVYIVGSSASINEMPGIHDFLKDKVCCLLNAVCLDDKFNGEYFFIHHTLDQEKYHYFINFTEKSENINKILMSDKFKFIPGYNNLIDRGIHLGDNTFTFSDHSKSGILLHHCKNISRDVGTIASDAMEIMAHIGYKKVYLIGVDLKKDKKHSYYDSTMKDKFKTKPENNTYMNSICEKYKTTKFINLSPWGPIDGVDMMEWERYNG